MIDLKRIKAFLWDFDGCLADTERIHYLAYREAFLQWGHDIDEKDYYAHFTHIGDGTIREIERSKLEIHPDIIYKKKTEVYQKSIKEGDVFLFPEIKEILKKASSLNILLSIASNSPYEDLEVILKKNQSMDFFHVITGRTPSMRKKPSPDVFLATYEKLKSINPSLLPDECLVLEDTEKGLMGAKAAGMKALWIRTIYNNNLNTDVAFDETMTHGEFLQRLKNL